LEPPAGPKEIKAFLDKIPVIQKLKETLPGQFVGYFSMPASDEPEAPATAEESGAAPAAEAEAEAGPEEGES
jgi:hypothetical protein